MLAFVTVLVKSRERKTIERREVENGDASYTRHIRTFITTSSFKDMLPKDYGTSLR
jgi:hypothetical protein